MFKNYISRLLHVFGWRFLSFLCVSQLALKGTLLYLVGGVMLPMFKNVLGVDAATLQLYMMLTMMPWSIKPLLGLLSDFVSINGLHKRPWLLQSLVLGSLGAVGAVLAYHERSALALALCFAGVQLQVALYDLMSEAVYSARMRNHDAQEQDPGKRTGSDVVTLSQMLQTCGGVLATVFVGLVADYNAYYALLGTIVGLSVLPLGPTLLGWISEERDQEHDPDDENETPDERRHCCWGRVRLASRERMRKQMGIIFVISFMGFAAPVTALISNTGDPAIALAVAALFTVAALVGAYMVFPRLVAHIALYQVLRNVASPSVGSALDYYYVASPECVPGGPNFSYVYYILITGLIGYGASFLGTFVYQALFSKHKYRGVLLVTTILSALFGAFDLIIILRVNVRWGIPDKFAYIFGEAVAEPLVGMLNYIPIMSLLSKSLPPGLESSAFAFLAGIYNFSGMIRELSGALLFDVVGLQTTVPCDFTALPWLVLGCHVLGPLVVGVAVSGLIPNVSQVDTLQPQNGAHTPLKTDDGDDVGELEVIPLSEINSQI